MIQSEIVIGYKIDLNKTSAAKSLSEICFFTPQVTFVQQNRAKSHLLLFMSLLIVACDVYL